MKMPELLAPAGNMESLDAALRGGADGVYLGYTAFGARAGAGNFTKEELAQAVRRCHLLGVRVYVTVNTLVKESEMASLRQVVALLSDLAVDGVILQDIGAAMVIRQEFPGLPLHASTQMAIHNKQGASFLLEEGFNRVVLARECTFDEIAEVAATGIETEVFVHGALCVSVSGQCLFSSMIGGRSGNRGRCAQPCRLPYRFQGRQGNWLSPKDICLRDHLDTLLRIGVDSLKIEGRLKRPEYVATVTRHYRDALDALNQGRFEKGTETEMDSLRQAFHRGGFFSGYGPGNRDAAVMDLERTGHGGISMGRVDYVRDGFAHVRLTRPLHDGDGLQFRGRAEWETTYAGKDCPSGETARVRLRPGAQASPGDALYRLCDADQDTWARGLVRERIPLEGALHLVPGDAAELRLATREVNISVCGEVVQRAEKAPITTEAARRAIDKLKDTPYSLEGFTLAGEGGFLPVSSLNALRREAVDALDTARIQAFEQARPSRPSYTPVVKTPEGHPFAEPMLMVRGGNSDLGHTFLREGADVFLLDPEDFRPEALRGQILDAPEGTWLCLPVQMQADTLTMVYETVNECRHHIGGVVLGNIGQLGLPWAVPVAAGESIPLWNTETLAFLRRRGTLWQTISPELNRQEMDALGAGANSLTLSVYGRERLMVLNHCPARVKLGLSGSRQGCALCDEQAPGCLRGESLIDRKGYAFPLARKRLPEGCLVEVRNALPTSLYKDAKGIGCFHWQLSFTTESEVEQLAILKAFHGLRKGKPAENPISESTSGHYRRGVE